MNIDTSNAATKNNISEFFQQYDLSYCDNGTVRIAYFDIIPENVSIKNSDTVSPIRPVVLLHGFPYDIHAYTEVTQILLARGHRVIVPYLRGYGPSRYSHADAIRSGQQAALAADLLALLQYCALIQPIIAGYDWGGRAACIVAALYPDMVSGLVTAGGYNLFDHAHSASPLTPEDDYRLWYQWYFHTERGRNALEQNRYDFCHLLWKLWSPSWDFTPETYALSAQAFENPDFVPTVISSYRHRHRADPGDPQYDDVEALLALQPDITVPSIALNGTDDEVRQGSSAWKLHKFTQLVDSVLLSDCGHNIPQEKPQEFAAAIVRLAEH